MSAPACMGGWCAVRDRCYHHQQGDRAHPVERMCETLGRSYFRPVVVYRRPIPEAA